MQNQSNKQVSLIKVTIAILIIVTVAEMFAMLFLSVLNLKLDSFTTIILDSIILGLLSVIPIYYGVLSPSLKKRNVALQALEELKFAIDQHSIVAITDTKGDITKVNDKFCEISGYKEEELLGENHRILNSGQTDKSYWQEMYKTVADGRVWRDEVCNRAKDGSLYWVDTTIIPIFNNTGKVQQYASIRTDITEKKSLEESIKRKNVELESAVSEKTIALESALKTAESDRNLAESIINTAVDAIIVIDQTGNIRVFSRSAERIFGYKKDDVLNQNIKMLMPSDLAKEHDKFLSDYKENKQSTVLGRERETVALHRNGNTFPIDLRVASMSFNGKVFYTGSIRDISARKKAESDLVAALDHAESANKIPHKYRHKRYSQTG